MRHIARLVCATSLLACGYPIHASAPAVSPSEAAADGAHAAPTKPTSAKKPNILAWMLDDIGIGFSLKEGKPTFIVNDITGKSFTIAASEALPRGKNRLELRVDQRPMGPTGPTSMKVAIAASGKVIAAGEIEPITPRLAVTSTETFDVGQDGGKPLTADYRAGVPFEEELSNVVFKTVD